MFEYTDIMAVLSQFLYAFFLFDNCLMLCNNSSKTLDKGIYTVLCEILIPQTWNFHKELHLAQLFSFLVGSSYSSLCNFFKHSNFNVEPLSLLFKPESKLRKMLTTYSLYMFLILFLASAWTKLVIRSVSLSYFSFIRTSSSRSNWLASLYSKNFSYMSLNSESK